MERMERRGGEGRRLAYWKGKIPELTSIHVIMALVSENSSSLQSLITNH
jgi:hypothetical protein